MLYCEQGDVKTRLENESMKLLPEADKVVRGCLPAVLDAVGRPRQARSLRELSPLSDRESIVAACGELRRVRIAPVDDAVWEAVIEEASFWCEAAVLAALRHDVSAFRHHVGKATEAMRAGLPVSLLH
jgi:hypothetical protein